jgi:hypothetical protein
MHTLAWNGDDGTGTHTFPTGQSDRAGATDAPQARTLVAHAGTDDATVPSGAQFPSDGAGAGTLTNAPPTPRLHCPACVTSTVVQALWGRLTAAHEVSGHVAEDV